MHEGVEVDVDVVGGDGATGSEGARKALFQPAPVLWDTHITYRADARGSEPRCDPATRARTAGARAASRSLARARFDLSARARATARAPVRGAVHAARATTYTT
jgi:hypothetical protein